MSTLSKINLNGTQYDIKEKLSSEYTSYNIAYEPLPGDYVETAISKLHKVILDNEYVTVSALTELKNKAVELIYINLFKGQNDQEFSTNILLSNNNLNPFGNYDNYDNPFKILIYAHDDNVNDEHFKITCYRNVITDSNTLIYTGYDSINSQFITVILGHGDDDAIEIQDIQKTPINSGKVYFLNTEESESGAPGTETYHLSEKIYSNVYISDYSVLSDNDIIYDELGNIYKCIYHEVGLEGYNALHFVNINSINHFYSDVVYSEFIIEYGFGDNITKSETITHVSKELYINDDTKILWEETRNKQNLYKSKILFDYINPFCVISYNNLTYYFTKYVNSTNTNDKYYIFTSYSQNKIYTLKITPFTSTDQGNNGFLIYAQITEEYEYSAETLYVDLNNPSVEMFNNIQAHYNDSLTVIGEYIENIQSSKLLLPLIAVDNNMAQFGFMCNNVSYLITLNSDGTTDINHNNYNNLPAASITAADIANWNSKTSNVGTITGITMNGVSKGTAGVVDLGTIITAHQDISGKQDVIEDLDTIRSYAALGATALQNYNETDPVFVRSAAYNITSTDIGNWNSKTSNVGTITGITMNGANKGTSGVVDLGTVITDISGKVDKESGKGLSTNDYTSAEKTKLASINIGDLSNLTTTELNTIFS